MVEGQSDNPLYKYQVQFLLCVVAILLTVGYCVFVHTETLMAITLPLAVAIPSSMTMAMGPGRAVAERPDTVMDTVVSSSTLLFSLFSTIIAKQMGKVWKTFKGRGTTVKGCNLH